jgi:hypothetical protein
MSLKLVSNNGEAIEVGNLGLVDEVQSLDLDGATSLVVMVLGDAHVSGIRVLGEALTDHELIGLFEAAKFDVLRDILDDD